MDDVDETLSAGPSAEALPDAMVLDRSRSLWREREPEDRSDAVDHLAREEASGPAGARLVAASRRGRAHAHDAKYREDSFRIAVEGEWLLAAVADGAGSHSLARVGSRLAAEAAVEHLRAGLAGAAVEPDCDVPRLLRGLLAGALCAPLASMAAEAARRGRDIADFSTTLVVAAYHAVPGAEWLGVAQVGDGGVAARTGSDDGSIVGAADRGPYAGETMFVTSREAQLTWPRRVSTYRLSEPPRCIVLASDGVLEDFTQAGGRVPALFAELEPLAVATDGARWLLDWLAYERRGSFDDRTLVALLPRPAEPEQPEQPEQPEAGAAP